MVAVTTVPFRSCLGAGLARFLEMGGREAVVASFIFLTGVEFENTNLESAPLKDKGGFNPLPHSSSTISTILCAAMFPAGDGENEWLRLENTCKTYKEQPALT